MSFSGLFSIGLSGVNAFASGLESVSSNIANSQTAGYKRFETTYAERVNASQATVSSAAGSGVLASASQLLTEQGAVTRTNTPTNVAVAGDGFFVVRETAASAGEAALFTRSGDFAPNTDGALVNGAGLFLQGVRGDADVSNASLGALETVNVNVAPALADGAADPGPLAGVRIDRDGRVLARYADGSEVAIFRIPLALFENAEGLEDAGRTAFRATPDAGDPRVLSANTGRAGAVEGAALEISTVDIGREFSALIETQRAYATNTRILRTADELWRTLVETAA